MKHAKTHFKRNDSGEVMLESSFILVAVILLLLALLSISFLFYQQAMMTSVANEVAAAVAKNHKFTMVSTDANSVEPEQMKDVKLYRYTFGKLGKNSVAKKHDALADTYASTRADLTGIGINAGDAAAVVEIKSTGIGRAYVKVTVSQKSDFFLSGILEFLGIYDESKFSAVAYAECSDMIAYASMVNLADYVGRSFSELEAFGDIYTNIKHIGDVLIG